MAKTLQIESKKILAVEGLDEVNFFTALLKDLDITGVQIKDMGGKDKFPTRFEILSNQDGFDKLEQVGFVRDAEINQADSAFDSICGVLRKHNFPIPPKQNAVLQGAIQVGVFIMPDNVNPGMLEELCLETVKNKKIYQYISAYIDIVQQYQQHDERLVFNEPKARVQTYLASRAPIVNRLGEGALSGYWDFNHLCFDAIKEFLRTLFS